MAPILRAELGRCPPLLRRVQAVVDLRPLAPHEIAKYYVEFLRAYTDRGALEQAAKDFLALLHPGAAWSVDSLRRYLMGRVTMADLVDRQEIDDNADAGSPPTADAQADPGRLISTVNDATAVQTHTANYAIDYA